MPNALPGLSSLNREPLSSQKMQFSSIYILEGMFIPKVIGAWQKPEKGCPLLSALLMGSIENGLF